VGIYELLRLDESIRTVVRKSGNIDEVRGISRANGMRLMVDDAMDKLRGGLTSLEEVLRVVPIENVVHADCPKCHERILPMFKYCPHCGTKNAVQAAPTPPRPTPPPSLSEEVMQ
jgi:hypothetical protein